ncbi:HlyD family secretion protein [bacterium]|nr:MAG: HlyD family secretion protein [bacterium]
MSSESQGGTVEAVPIAQPEPPEEPRPTPPKPKKRSVLPFVVGGLVLVGGFFAYRSWSYGQAHVSTDDAQVTSNIVQVSPQVAGTVIKVHVEDNEVVEEGDLIAELDPATYQTAVSQAKANLALAVAQAKEADANVGLADELGNAQVQQAQGGVEQSAGAISGSIAGVTGAEATIATARAQASGARSAAKGTIAGVRSAEANLQRANDGVRQARTISAQAADQAATQLTVAQSGLAAAQEQESSAQALIAQRQAEVSTALSQVEAAKAAIAQANAQVQASNDGVRAADQAVLQAQAQAQAARTNVLQARARSQQAAGTLAQANTSSTQVEIRRVGSEQAKAKVEQARAALEAAELQLRRTKLYAAASGRISKKTATVGAQVQPGTLLMAIVPQKAVWVVANFKETQLADVKVNQPVDIEVDALPGVSFKGHIDSLSAGTGATFALLPPDNATGNFTKVVQRVPVKIVFEPGQERLPDLRVGMSVLASVHTRGAGS